MRLALFGPPGAGKGTQAKLLVKRLGLAHISTGDIIRTALKGDSDLGAEVRAYVHAGQLVPGKVVRRLAEDAIAACGNDHFVLDGYPRTIEQAEWLDAYLEEVGTALDAVISLSVPDNIIVERLSKRRVHKQTGENFHLDFKPPPDDVSKDMIMQRPDDRPEAILSRLDVYKSETAPVEEYYRAKGLLINVVGVGDFESVHARVLEAIGAPAEG